ncbi:YHS domain-containing (seleno)protein [Flavobacterium sp. SUN052]|uniref:YHS domain-containing (seleno)protein n=1 Tax=Flavobacterium sp. SUN052 TaxID=3002441 RepID=UPI00237EBC08|nr:YHS domain-containing (seleno)protein [Flavobacterium sp. SUN052]MEC4005687.1 YHS domain-containing (seleno)protein [Flavobacterium sp. SUN052]
MKKQILILIVAFISATTFAQSEKKIDAKLAIKGYDVVAYFQENKAVKGEKSITTIYNDKIYYFASENNKSLFLKNPSYYEPQFGGYCAYGMSEGHEAPIQPEAFTIVDDKLYLNYNLETRTEWQKEQKERIVKADANWAKTKK